MKKYTAEEIRAEFPVTLKLRFASEEELDEFLGQLSDGWGENYVDLRWEWGRTLDQATTIGVKLFEDEP